MTNQKNDMNKHRPISPRESDDPIAEEFREDLLQKPSFASQSANRLIIDEDKLARMEGMLAELLQRTDTLERRVQTLEGEARR